MTEILYHSSTGYANMADIILHGKYNFMITVAVLAVIYVIYYFSDDDDDSGYQG